MLFWEDPWLNGYCIAAPVPDLVEAMLQHYHRCCTVHQVPHDNTSITDITGTLTIQVLLQYL
jgi:hypothetical protein